MPNANASRRGNTRSPQTRSARGPGARPQRARAASRRGIAGGWIQRRQPEPTGIKKLLGALTRGKGGKGSAAAAGGLALISAAGGLAYRNRDKLPSRFTRTRNADHEPPATASETVVTTPGPEPSTA